MSVTTLKIVKSNLGLFVNFGSYYKTDIKDMRVNGVIPEYTHHKQWGLVLGETEVKKLEFFEQNERINNRYDLKNPELATALIPKSIPAEKITREDGEWAGEYESLEPLYNYAFDLAEPKWIEKPFETSYDPEIFIESYNRPVEMKVKFLEQNWFDTREMEKGIEEIVDYNELVSILVPEFLKHERPCSLSSDQLYKIVRAYIKDKHNPEFCRISSDYDFCFTVQKRIKIKPYTKKWEEKKWNGRSYSKPRYRSKEVNFKEVEIFEMTPATKKYNNYTVIVGFTASNLQEMADRLKAYLDDLIEYINAPAEECQACQGCGGFVVGKKPLMKEYA